MKFLAEKLRQLYVAIPRADRIQLKANGTVAIGMATVDGTPRLVYTVNNNGGSAAFHAAAERLALFRWTYDPGVQGRGAVGAPNDAEQLMMGFSKDNRAPLHGIVVSRTPCRDCATVIPAYGGGRLRLEHIPDTADLPNPRNPPSRLNPPAQTVHGEIDTKKPPGAPPGRTLSGPTKPPDLPPGSVFARNRPVFEQIDKPIIALPKTAPAQPPPPSPATTSTTTTTKPTTTNAAPTATTPSSTPPPLGTVRAAIVPTAMIGANFLAGLAISWYANKQFQRSWAEAMQGVESWLRLYLPAYRPSFAPGTPLFAIVQLDVGSGSMYMGPRGGWTGTAPSVKVEQIRVVDYPLVTPYGRTWIEKSPWWTMLLGFSYKSTHVRFSFPLPEEQPKPPGPGRVLIDAGPEQRPPIRTSERPKPIATGGSTPRIPIRSGGGPGT